MSEHMTPEERERLAKLAEFLEPLTHDWLMGTCEALERDEARGMHSETCASVRYPGSYMEPPDPCTCYGVEAALLLASVAAKDAEIERLRTSAAMSEPEMTPQLALLRPFLADESVAGYRLTRAQLLALVAEVRVEAAAARLTNDPLRVFGHAAGIALSERKIPEGVDPERLTPGESLEATAGLLDRLDDATDAYLAAHGSEHRVGRTMQARLRRIAATLSD